MLVPAAAQIREICTRPSRANDTGLQTPGRRSASRRRDARLRARLILPLWPAAWLPPWPR